MTGGGGAFGIGHLRGGGMQVRDPSADLKRKEMNLWVGLTVCRAFRRFSSGAFSSDLLWWRYES